VTGAALPSIRALKRPGKGQIWHRALHLRKIEAGKGLDTDGAPKGSGSVLSAICRSVEQGGKSMLVRDVMRKTVSVHAEETLQVAAFTVEAGECRHIAGC
jgi:hypothetical protein